MLLSSESKKRCLDHNRSYLKNVKKFSSHSYKFYQSCFSIPNPCLTTLIFTYIEPREVISNILYVSKTWKSVLLSSSIWEYYENNHGILSRITINPFKILSERRSKGKVYMGKYLGKCLENENDFENVIVRVVNLRLTNSGKDDGVPTSSLREISCLKILKNHNIVRFYGSQVINDIIYIVTEYVRYNLNEYMDRKHSEFNNVRPCRNFIKTEIMKVMMELIKALSFIHSKKIFHRNLKPENIFIDCEIEIENSRSYHKFKRLKIGDFGMGRLTGLVQYSPEETKERYQSFRECRRLFYRAPEIMLRCQTYDEFIDLWSIGIIFYEMVCHDTLLNGINEISLIWDICKITGFPEYSLINSISLNLYLKWDKIIGRNKPIDIQHIVAISVQKYRKFKDYYSKYGQLKHFEKLFTFYKIMGFECLKLLLGLLNVIPSDRPKLNEVVQNSHLWDIKMSKRECVCLINDTECELTYEKLLYSDDACYNYEYTSMISMYDKSSIRCGRINIKKDIHITDSIMDYRTMYMHIVNWYFFVASYFKLSSTTVHVAAGLVIKANAILANIRLDKLVSVFISCLKIAHRLNEVSQECYKCDNLTEYSVIASISDSITKILNSIKNKSKKIRIPDRNELLYHEKEILELIKFNLSVDTLSYLVCDMGKMMGIAIDTKCSRFALLLSDLCIYHEELNSFNNELKAQIIWMVSIVKYNIRTKCLKGTKEQEGLKEDTLTYSQFSTQASSLPNDLMNDDRDMLVNRGSRNYKSEFVGMNNNCTKEWKVKVDMEDEEFKFLIEMIDKIESKNGWYRSKSVCEVIKCVTIIEEIANVGCKKMKITNDQNAVYEIHKIDFGIDGIVNIPFKLAKILVDEDVQGELSGISEDILCRKLIL